MHADRCMGFALGINSVAIMSSPGFVVSMVVVFVVLALRCFGCLGLIGLRFISCMGAGPGSGCDRALCDYATAAWPADVVASALMS
jgi:hypothetical protein